MITELVHFKRQYKEWYTLFSCFVKKRKGDDLLQRFNKNFRYSFHKNWVKAVRGVRLYT
jgi:hypothetical protein